MNFSRQITLADVMKAVEPMDLPGTTRRDVLSAIRKVGEVLNRNPAEIPADPSRLNARLQEIAPAAIGLSQQRWSNVRSLVLKGIGLVRPVMAGRRITKLMPEWAALRNQVPKEAGRIRLGTLMRFLSEEGIGPDQVTEADLIRYRDRLFSESLRRGVKKTWDHIIWEWNRAVREIDGFPQITIDRPNGKDRKTLSPDVFPVSLWSDSELWLDRLQGKDVLADGPVRAVSDSTRKTREYQLLYFASALVEAGLDPNSLTSLDVLVAPENFEKGMRLLFDRKERQKTSHLGDIGGGLISLARHYVLPRNGTPETDRDTILARMRLIVSRVSQVAEGLTDKNLDRLMQFESPEAVGRFLNLPAELKREVESGKLPINQTNSTADVALALEIAIMAPVRNSNLSQIKLDKNLIRYREGYLLTFQEEEVKNKQRLQFILPPETCAMIDWYLKTIRANRLKGETDALFLGEDGLKPIAKNTLSTQISKKVFQKTGLKFNVHLIRHATSLMYLNQVPGGHHVLRMVLGHKSIDTTLRSYSGAEAKSAVAHFDKVITGLRDAHQTQPNRPRGRPKTSQPQDPAKLAQAVLPDSGKLPKRGR
jgi:integrase